MFFLLKRKMGSHWGGTMAASQVTRSFAKYHGTWCLELNKLFDQRKWMPSYEYHIYIYLLPRNYGYIYT